MARKADLGRNDTMYTTITHLGQILHPGDTALGYDLEHSNAVDPDLDRWLERGGSPPEVILVCALLLLPPPPPPPPLHSCVPPSPPRPRPGLHLHHCVQRCAGPAQLCTQCTTHPGSRHGVSPAGKCLA